MAFLSRLIFGAGIGAALMYVFDPDRGTRRRAALREQALSTSNRLRDAADTTIKDTRNRAKGIRSSLLSRWRKAPATDEALAERVRSTIGRCVSHPGAIEVTVSNGSVTLLGSVLSKEVALLIDRVYDVPGVTHLTNQLRAYTDAGQIPALQGAGKQGSKYSFGFFQSNWSPAARLTAGAAGLAATAIGFASRGIAPKFLGAAGAMLLTRAATNLDMVRLTGIRKRYSINVQKSIRINAPVERVFDVWANNANFPQFMTHVREVHPLDNGATKLARRWHWKIQGSSGFETEFTAQTTAYEENRFLAWRSEPGSLVQHAGYARFQANDDRSTTVDVRLSYTPPAGAIGHVIAKIIGDDPKSQMDDDLMRMKEYIETGKQPRDAALAGKAGQPATTGRPQPEF
jgi:uncharacterized membrane protein